MIYSVFNTLVLLCSNDVVKWGNNTAIWLGLWSNINKIITIKYKNKLAISPQFLLDFQFSFLCFLMSNRRVSFDINRGFLGVSFYTLSELLRNLFGSPSELVRLEANEIRRRSLSDPQQIP